MNTTRLSPAPYESSWSPFCWCTNSAPANAARKPDIANACSVVVRGFTPNALAARSFSRIATSARPVRLRRMPDDGDDHERQRDEAEEVVARLRAHVDDAEEVAVARRAAAAASRSVCPRRRCGAEQPRGRRQAERERDHGEGEAASSQHGQADERGDTGADDARAEEAEREVPAEARGERPADGGADRHERHLPEADLAGPPGEDDERQGDDPVDHRHRREVGAALGEHDGHEREGDDDHRRGAPHA